MDASYNDAHFWSKVNRLARVAGYEVLGMALRLYFALQSDQTPLWARGVITSALVYFIARSMPCRTRFRPPATPTTWPCWRRRSSPWPYTSRPR